MRSRRLVIAVLALCLGASTASAQTVTPVASQLLPCRAGAGPANSCGGLCAVGYTCVYVPANSNCSCQLNELVCQIGTNTTNGYCAALPTQVGGNCQPRGTTYRCE